MLLSVWVLILYVAVLPYLSRCLFETPRDFLLAATLPALLAAWAWSGGAAVVASLPLLLAAAVYLSALCFATITATRPDLAVPALLRHAGAVLLGFAASGGSGVLSALVAAAVIQAVVVVGQQFFFSRVQIDKTAICSGGLAGNTNWSGAWLAPAAFVALHQGLYATAAVIGVGLAAGRCRGAMLAVIFASAVEPMGIIVAGAMGVHLLLSYWLAEMGRTGFAPVYGGGALKSAASVSERLQYWRGAIAEAGLRVAAAGLGPDCAQAWRRRRGDRRGQPMMYRRAHNDLLQALLDGGVVLAAAHVSMVAVAVYSAWTAGAPALAAALLALVVCGLVFHPMSTAIGQITWWIVACQVGAVPAVVRAAPLCLWWLALAAVLMVAVTWGRILIADIFDRRAPHTRAPALWQERAHRLLPTGSVIAGHLTLQLINQGRALEALYRSAAAINRYDGEADFGKLLFAHGIAAMRSLNPPAALPVAAFDQALACNPDDPDIRRFRAMFPPGDGGRHAADTRAEDPADHRR